MKPLLRKLAISALALGVGLSVATVVHPALADSWIFQPSYYTQEPAPCVKIGAARYLVLGGPFYTPPQGAYVRSGYRNSINTIQVGNQTFDQTNVWDSWIQVGTQY